MHELKILQEQIAAALNNSAMQELPVLIDMPPLSSAQRLAIYRNSFNAALLKVMQDVYPVCAKIVGEDFFRAMSLIYIKQTPSLSPNIDDYGASFAGFIGTFPHSQHLDYLPDVARLEWAWYQTLLGADYTALDVNALRQINETQQSKLSFKLPINSRLISSLYPIHRIWEFNQKTHLNGKLMQLESDPAQLFIWRPQQLPLIEILNNEEWQLLIALQQNLSLAKLSPKQMKLLPELVKRGWINHFE